MDFLDLLGQFGLQLLFTVGLIVIVGLTVAGAKHFFLRSCGRAGYHIELVSGAIGTPIHELSHALFCLIFGHKIEAIRLLHPARSLGNARLCVAFLSETKSLAPHR